MRLLRSDEHFDVDGTLINARASQKSFRCKDDDTAPSYPPQRNPEGKFKGQTRYNDTPKSMTATDVRLYRNTRGDKSRL